MPSKRKFDHILFLTTFTLMGIGVVMVFNASAMIAVMRYEQPCHFFLRRHTINLCFALIGLVVGIKIPYKMWSDLAPLLLILSLVGLLLVFIPGIGCKIGGARRWIRLGLFRLQPSEIAKISLIIYIASFMSRKGDKLINEFQSIAPPLMAVLGLYFFLIVIEPDLGTAVLIIIVALTMLFVAEVKMRYLLIPTLIFSLCIIFLIWTAPYRVSRIFSYLNPYDDPSGSGYQLLQSIMSIGSGGFFGLGLGHVIQNGIRVVEPFTDFIFAIIAHELGFLGSLLIIFLFFVFVWRGLSISLKEKNRFAFYLAVGLTCLIGYQSLINLGVVCGLLPTKGIPLPFISFGGSALLVNAFSVGVLLNVSQA
ncbi:MAG: putative lipid II flippase FtsW [bacterium]